MSDTTIHKRQPRQLIYTPSGRAGEYANHGFAANLFKGCTNGCKYCYVPSVPWLKRDDFHASVVPVPDMLERLEYDLTKRRGIPHPLPEPLFLCFTCDPYPPHGYEAWWKTTYAALKIIKESGNNVRILTKGFVGDSDIQLLKSADEFGVTLTLDNDTDSRLWEPGAVEPRIRLANLARAHWRGIRTWASLEPVIDPAQTLELIEWAAPHLDYCKIGKFNHSDKTVWPSDEWKQRVQSIDWHNFTNRVARLCDELGLPRYIKDDLRPYLDSDVNPDTTVSSIGGAK